MNYFFWEGKKIFWLAKKKFLV